MHAGAATHKPLTDRQRRFVEAFHDMEPSGGRLCAAKAARFAGYAWPLLTRHPSPDFSPAETLDSHGASPETPSRSNHARDISGHFGTPAP
jgi:hypothetical protein